MFNFFVSLLHLNQQMAWLSLNRFSCMLLSLYGKVWTVASFFFFCSFAQEAMNQKLHKHYATLAMLANSHIMGHHVKPVIQEATVLKEMKNVLSALLDTSKSCYFDKEISSPSSSIERIQVYTLTKFQIVQSAILPFLNNWIQTKKFIWFRKKKEPKLGVGSQRIHTLWIYPRWSPKCYHWCGCYWFHFVYRKTNSIPRLVLTLIWLCSLALTVAIVP